MAKSSPHLTLAAAKIALALNPDGLVKTLADGLFDLYVDGLGSCKRVSDGPLIDDDSLASIAETVGMIDDLGIPKLAFSRSYLLPGLVDILGVEPRLWDRFHQSSTHIDYECRLIVDGNLDLRGLDNISVPDLAEVRGSLNLAGAIGIDLPALRTIGGCIQAHHSQHVSMPVLTSVRGHLWAERSVGLAVPALVTIKGDFNLEGARGVNAPNLGEVGDLMADNTGGLSLPSLRTIGEGLSICDTRDLALPALERVGYDIRAERAELPSDLTMMLCDMAAKHNGNCL